MQINREFDAASEPTGALAPVTRLAYQQGEATAAGEGAPFAIRTGQAVAAWFGARERGETGVEAVYGVVAFALFEIPAMPDFNSSRFPDLGGLDAAERTERIATQQAALLTALHTLGPQIGASLRYLYRQRPSDAPDGADREQKIRCFLVGRAFGATVREACDGVAVFGGVIARHLPPGYPIRACSPEVDAQLADLVLFPQDVAGLCEVLKPEQVLRPWHEAALTGFSFWYHPIPFAPAASNDMSGFCHALLQEGRRATMEERPVPRTVAPRAGVPPADLSILVDVTLVPAGPLTPVEQHEIASWALVAERWSRNQHVQVPGGLHSKERTVEVAADPHAEDVSKALTDQGARYGTPQQRSFLYAARALVCGGSRSGVSRSRAVASALAVHALSQGSGSQLIALGPGDSPFERAVRSIHGCYVTPAVCNGAIWQHPEAPETMRRLHRLATIGEIGTFFRLPVPGRDGCPGMPLDAGLL